MATVSEIKLETAVKVILIFKKRFWPKELHGMICAGCLIPEIWFIERGPEDFAAVGFATSPCAKKVQSLGQEQVHGLERHVRSLIGFVSVEL